MAFAKFIKNILIIAIVSCTGYYAYKNFMLHDGAGAPHGMPMGGAAPVSVATVVNKDIQQWNEFSGRLVAVDRVEVRPRVSGVIETVNFENGAFVKKDDLLFTIDSKAYSAEVSRAEGNLASTMAQVSLADTELARADRLLKDKAIPQKEYDERRNAHNVAQANLKSAQASLETAKLNLEYTKVKSPISGKVSRAEITTGNLVESGSNAPILTSVVSSNPIYADFEVDEYTYLEYTSNPTVTNNSKVPVIMSLGSANAISHSGYVESFDNRLNTASGTIRARAVFDNSDGLLVPGLFARIKLGNAEKAPALLISDRAIGTDQNKKFVFVVEPDNKISYREIKLGPVADGMRIVREGLKAGEKIVVNGLQRVRPGAQIQPEMVAMETGLPSAAETEPAAGVAEAVKEMPATSDSPDKIIAQPIKDEIKKTDLKSIPEIPGEVQVHDKKPSESGTPEAPESIPTKVEPPETPAMPEVPVNNDASDGVVKNNFNYVTCNELNYSE